MKSYENVAKEQVCHFHFTERLLQPLLKSGIHSAISLLNVIVG